MPREGVRAGQCAPGSEQGHSLLLPAPAAWQCSTICSVNSSSLLLCQSPAVLDGARPLRVFFTLDNMHVDFASTNGGQDFLYQPNPRLVPLSREGPARPYRVKPGNVLDVEVRALPASSVQPVHSQAGWAGSGARSVCQGEGLSLGISKEEVRVQIGNGECLVKTLTLTHLYCEPPPQAPQPVNGSSTLPRFVVRLGSRCAAVWVAGHGRPLLRNPAPTLGTDGQRAAGPGPCPVRG